MQGEHTSLARTESHLAEVVEWLRLAVETIGAAVIAVGVAIALARALHALVRPGSQQGFIQVRLTLARYLALALEFQLAADILSTAIAPSWTSIGQLAAIAVIRTALNFFLTREMEAFERGSEGAGAHAGSSSGPTAASA
jgi:uncharacterized membrane protein